MATIFANGNEVEASSQQEGGIYFAAHAADSNYLLIHCNIMLTPDYTNILEQHHVKVQHFISNNTYLCRYEPADLECIRQLPFVVYANVYHSDLVIDAALQRAMTYWSQQALEEQKKFDIRITLHSDHSRSSEAIEADLSRILDVDISTILVSRNRVEVQATPAQLLDIASMDEVQRVEEKGIVRVHYGPDTDSFSQPVHRVQHDICATEVLKLRNYDGIPLIDGLDKLGEGEILVIQDSTFDYKHPAFANRYLAGDQYDWLTWWQQKLRNDNKNDIADGINPKPEDREGHGTHVAAIAAGNYKAQRIQAIPTRELGGEYFNYGIAPGAQLALMALGKEKLFEDVDNGKIDPQKTLASSADEYEYVYNTIKGRVLNRSWGELMTIVPSSTTRIQGDYRDLAAVVDAAIEEVEDFVVIVSAGNEGLTVTDVGNDRREANTPPWAGGAQISSHSAAKNAITVGACHNSDVNWWCSGSKLQATEPFPALWPPATWAPKGEKWQKVNGNPNRLWKKSSRGPVLGKASANKNERTFRQKPDVVAPGFSILSAKSAENLVEASISNTFGYTVLPDGNEVARDKRELDGEPLSMFMCGTSVAGPIVAGCCAIIRAVWRDIFIHTNVEVPSALIKALIVNGAEYIPDLTLELNPDEERLVGPLPKFTSLTGKPPDYAQGFGRVNLCRSLMPRMVYGSENGEGGMSWSDFDWTLDVPLKTEALNIGKPLLTEEMEIMGQTFQNRLTITMCWNDPAGTLGVGEFIHQLSLRVEFDLGATRQVRYANTHTDKPEEDGKNNNVQKLIWDNIPGEATDVVAVIDAIKINTHFHRVQTWIAWLWDCPMNSTGDGESQHERLYKQMARTMLPRQALDKFKEYSTQVTEEQDEIFKAATEKRVGESTDNTSQP